ncbi:MAG: hypothetical protein SCJ93_14340, partial [Bacillota bacterium]|nr:hypothetical protein [Bacillota bacterium]
MKTKTLITLIITILLITGGTIYGQGNAKQEDPRGHQKELENREPNLEVLQEYSSSKHYNSDSYLDITDNKITTITAIVTAYAPFDNQSGMCNDGDPTSTATGTYPK